MCEAKGQALNAEIRNVSLPQGITDLGEGCYQHKNLSELN